MGRKLVIWAQAFWVCLLIGTPLTAAAADAELSTPQVFLEGIAYDVQATLPEPGNAADPTTPLLRVNALLYTPDRRGDQFRY